MRHHKHLTERPVVAALLALAAPIMLANMLQSAYQLIDTFWVGRLGAEAVAAVSVSFPILFFLISFGFGFAVAGSVLVAQYAGKRDGGMVGLVSAQSLLMVSVAALVITAIGYAATPRLISFMGVDAAVFPDAVSYLRISFLGIIFLFGYAAFQSLMQGVGDVKKPLYIVLATVLMNLILDPLFILGWGPIPAYGVAGAALATIATQSMAAVVGIAMLLSGKHGIHIKKKNFIPDIPLMKKMLKLAIPASLEHSTRTLSMLVMMFLVASFGTFTLASYGIGMRVLGFVIIPALGLMVSNSTLVGQNIGAGKMKRAERTSKISALVSFGILSAAGALLFYFALSITAAFIPSDMEVARESALLVRIMALTFGFIGLQMIFSGTFRGAGKAGTAMLLTFVSFWLLQFPLAFVLSKFTSLGARGLWWAFPVSNVAGALIAWLWYRTGSWKHKNLIGAAPVAGPVLETEAISAADVKVAQ